MIGIGGIGMAGLARLLQQRGHQVDGCDEQENRQTAWLRAKGIPVTLGRSAAHAASADWIIRTTAVPDDHPEVRGARVPVHRRGEVLPALLRDRITLAVSGTHGKTTTTSMIAQILGCGYCIGGEVPGFDGVACDGPVMAVEADESDGTIVNYSPDIAVITNIEYDHMEHHASAAAFEACFVTLMANTRGTVLYCADDSAATRLCAGHPKAVPYGFGLTAPAGPVSLPGRHNALNALAATEVARRMGASEEQIRTALARIRPVRRRFERLVEGEITILSDYAHHPTEIRTLIETARETFRPQRLLGVFQPHRYTRTQALLNDFPPAFQGLDRLWLLPVYAASEKPLPGGTTEDLMGRFSKEWNSRIKFFQTQDETWQNIRAELRRGDVLLIIGAGDIERLAETVREEYAAGSAGAL
jgi:UDP-N-acetylmuramate--alanine ligase